MKPINFSPDMYFRLNKNALEQYIDRLNEEKRIISELYEYSFELQKSEEMTFSGQTTKHISSSYELLEHSFNDIIALFDDLLIQVKENEESVYQGISELRFNTQKIFS